MALSPCSVDKARYRGPAHHVYPAILVGVETQRTHHRLCVEHLDEMLTWLDAHLDRVELQQDFTQPVEQKCLACEQPIGFDRAAVFVTAYPLQDERIDFFGVSCTSALCLKSVRKALSL